MITLSQLEPSALSSMLLVAVFCKLGELGKLLKPLYIFAGMPEIFPIIFPLNIFCNIF